MEKKLRIYILGEDRSLLNGVISKLNTSRPVEATLFTDLKDFLAGTMGAPPDIFAVSMDYPHPKIARFPKVFKMAMNLPVIIFAETNEPKSRKAVSLCQADFKISSKITAHNLWMKILNLQREAEKAEAEGRSSTSKGANIISGNAEKEGPAYNPMASLLTQLGGDGPDDGFQQKNHHHIKSGSDAPNSLYNPDSLDSSGMTALGKNAVHVKSGEATKYKKQQASTVTDMTQDSIYMDDSEDEFGPGNKMTGFGDRFPSSNIEKITNLDAADEKASPDGSATNFSPKIGGHNSVQGTFNPDELNSLMNGNFMDSTDSSFNSNPNMTNHIKGSLEKPAKKDGERVSVQDVHAKKMTNDPNSDDVENEKNNQDEIDATIANLMKQKDNEEFSEDESSTDVVLSSLPTTEGSDSEADAKDPGDVDNAQEAENELDKAIEAGEKKPEQKKAGLRQIAKDQGNKQSKEEKEAEFKHRKSLLEDACNIALPEIFGVKELKESRNFDIENLAVFSINQPSFKGYVLFANSFNHKEDRNQMDDMKSIISDHLDKNGMTGGIGNFFEFNVPTVEYTNWCAETCEFSIQYEDDSGKQFFLSFLSREKVLPPYTEADKNNDMIRVDLQHIPPDTPVDFDAFIHLPLNKRYVRYLKKERSISLDQAKRLLKDTEHKRLYVPKSEKQKFIQFYIKNAIYWEIMAYKKQNAA